VMGCPISATEGMEAFSSSPDGISSGMGSKSEDWKCDNRSGLCKRIVAAKLFKENKNIKT